MTNGVLPKFENGCQLTRGLIDINVKVPITWGLHRNKKVNTDNDISPKVWGR